MALTSYSYKVGTAPDALAAAVVASEKTPVGTLVQYGGNLLQFIGDGSVDIGAVSDYDIVAARTPDALVEAVNASITAGRQPVGNPLYRAEILYVVMGKITPLSTGGSDYTLPAATVDTLGGVKELANIGALASDADVATVVTALNSLLSDAKAKGLMVADA